MSLFLGEEFSGKWLELLREAVPNASRIAILLNPTHPASVGYKTVLRDVAQKLGVELHFQEVQDPGQFESAFETIIGARAQALVVVIDPLTVRYRGPIVELAKKNRLPTMYGFPGICGRRRAHGVRGRSIPSLRRHAAVYVDKILKGTDPGDLPVEQPTQFEFVINLKTAEALGLVIPPSLVTRADEVIE